MTGSGVQLGDKVNAYLMANNANSNTINELLLRYQDSNPEKRQIKLYRDEIASLYSKKVLSVSISTDEEELIIEDLNDVFENLHYLQDEDHLLYLFLNL